MKKRTRKLLTVLLAVVMALSSANLQAFAAELEPDSTAAAAESEVIQDDSCPSGSADLESAASGSVASESAASESPASGSVASEGESLP
ncbi:MAG: hypothetical protein J6P72_00280, partial [Firmicutes bacterium]|nr:hypothetical protein [Bacillota bacterium]